MLLSATSVSFAASKDFETKVFLGQLTVIDNNKATLESQSLEEIAKENKTVNKEKVLKKNQQNKYTQAELNINLHNLSVEEKKNLFSKCNDGQVCKITARVKKDNEASKEIETYALIGIRKVEVVAQ